VDVTEVGLAAERSHDRCAALRQLQRLLAGMGKTGQSITVRDILQHIELVKATVPQLLQDFPKIDHDGCGKISAKQLEDYLSPEKKGELGKKELQEIWDRLTSGRTEALPADRVFLQDLARHYQFAESVLPDLVGRFHEVDTDRSCSIERNEFDAFFGNGEAWLEARLANVIGLRELKEQIRTYYWSTRLDRMRRRGGSFVNNDDAHVLMFKGNPGVGKTTIARLITGLLHKIGVIPTENFVEVQRDQLVGDHIGATEKATEEAIAQAAGGVLFVDEAYRLNVDVFGVEAINCLMKAMSVKGNVIILAGYPKQMDEFVGVNPGIKRRVTYEFAFPDYGPEDLAKIFEHQVKKRGFEVAEGATTEVIASAIERFTTQDQRAALNGGVGEHACRHAIFHLNSRQISTVRAAAQSEEEVAPSVTLEVEDIEFGCTQVPQTDGLGPDALPSAFPTGKRPTHGVKRGLSGLTGQ
jgi:stage V sporulation protein K